MSRRWDFWLRRQYVLENKLGIKLEVWSSGVLQRKGAVNGVHTLGAFLHTVWKRDKLHLWASWILWLPETYEWADIPIRLLKALNMTYASEMFGGRLKDWSDGDVATNLHMWEYPINSLLWQEACVIPAILSRRRYRRVCTMMMARLVEPQVIMKDITASSLE